ncbi:hypothetical protein WN48_07886 [Eufriesea mexicana]|uniref:Uncharacterized protein n=1 Tax=Eufriesea mexicana TaxID=516756 RepID=A0A310SJG3_9HYME|nr:hypothetical protein WN48_07886 [Eufriesea mexicana]
MLENTSRKSAETQEVDDDDGVVRKDDLTIIMYPALEITPKCTQKSGIQRAEAKPKGDSSVA